MTSFLAPIPSHFSLPGGELPPGKSVCIASSRLGQKLDDYDRWFDAIRTLALRLDPQDCFFITAAGMTADPFVRRISQLFGFQFVELVPKPDTDVPNNDSNAPTSVDATVIAIASQVHLLSVRKNGNIHAAAISRLKNQSRQSSHDQARSETRLLVEPLLTKKSVANELIEAGAIGWWLYDNFPDQETSGQSVQVDTNLDAPILTLDEIRPDRFLMHWTRRRVGPWPDQSMDEYLDDLIFQSQRRQHDEQAALSRILATHRLLGSRELTRDDQPVVCFSNRPMSELSARKIFRQHLGRWDFLPYGIAIDRAVLNSRGARPVIYGNEATWDALPTESRPFYQAARSKNGRIDWTEEREWRMLGDLDLNQLPIDSVLVFVASTEDAIRISPLSRWPIVALR